MYYARSARGNIPCQPYAEHVSNVMKLAAENAEGVCHYTRLAGAALRACVAKAALYHDLGKLCAENQAILCTDRSKAALPIYHWDAGTAHCLNAGGLSAVSAVLIQAHHCGLANFVCEGTREGNAFRDAGIMGDMNRRLPQLLAAHKSAMGEGKEGDACERIAFDPQNIRGVFYRIAQSCLVDADHSDAATYGRGVSAQLSKAPLRAHERLEALDRFVAALAKEGDERTRLRQAMYAACRDMGIAVGIASCDGPVGSGKTTAVMAHLLAQAIARGLRRIFVILPFTNIIAQSVEVYREALTLPGERPEDVVAELHHRAEFESIDARRLTALWRAPIIVTTAVAFFETLAAKTPSALRRLHELPGSAIFVDESHAALPAHLLPLAWRWMKLYARDWGCYWLLASGSLSRFWTIDEIGGGAADDVPEIVEDSLRTRLSHYEKQRITYRHDLHPKGIAELGDWVGTLPGPRLVIVNTVQNAAVLANHLRNRNGRGAVEHLSSALTPADRERALGRVKERLNAEGDEDWTLVATSCVEAGVDLSFRTGFREAASVVSLLQAAGRINRKGHFDDAEIWTFVLAMDPMLDTNPGLKQSSEILIGYLREGREITPEMSTESIGDEIVKYGMPSKTSPEAHYKALFKNEKDLDFPAVEKGFRVIDSNSRIAVVDAAYVEMIRYGKIDWQTLQRQSVQIAQHLLRKMRAQEIAEGIFHWILGYDDFLGYMVGIL